MYAALTYDVTLGLSDHVQLSIDEYRQKLYELIVSKKTHIRRIQHDHPNRYGVDVIVVVMLCVCRLKSKSAADIQHMTEQQQQQQFNSRQQYVQNEVSLRCGVDEEV
jgi:hypothetical protein